MSSSLVQVVQIEECLAKVSRVGGEAGDNVGRLDGPIGGRSCEEIDDGQRQFRRNVGLRQMGEAHVVVRRHQQAEAASPAEDSEGKSVRGR